MRPHDLLEAVLKKDGLAARQWVKDAKRVHFSWANAAPPESTDVEARAVYAALVDLFAERQGVQAPSWVASVGRAPQPVFLLEAATKSDRVRERCLNEAPLALSRHNVFALHNYLEML